VFDRSEAVPDGRRQGGVKTVAIGGVGRVQGRLEVIDEPLLRGRLDLLRQVFPQLIRSRSVGLCIPMAASGAGATSLDVASAYVADAGWRYIAPRDAWLHAPMNLVGFTVLIGVAYSVAWFKKQPWRQRPSVREHRGKTGSGEIRPMAAE
jgi:hypothetical protein